MEKNTLKEKIHLSIIIPIYNTPLAFVKECLNSIEKAKIRYTYEIIILNDGSTDTELVSFLKKHQDSHTSIIHKENTGVSSSRNIGFAQAKGEYLLCLDADDLLLPTVNKALEYLEKNKNYDVLYCDLQSFGDANYLHKKCEFSKFQLIYISNMLTPSSTIFKREITANILFNENISFSEDREFFARIASAGFSFKHFPTPFCLYRRIFNSQSLSQKNIGMKNEVESFIKSQFDPHKEITQEEVNKYVINNFSAHKKHFIKLLLIIFFPALFKVLRSKNIYKNNIVID